MLQKEKIKKILFFLLKILLAATVVGILFSRGQQEILKAFRTFDFRYLLPAVLLSFLQIFFSALRWHALAKVLQIRLTLAEAFSLTMQGNFTFGAVFMFQGFLGSFLAPAMTLVDAGQTIFEMRSQMECVEDVMEYREDEGLAESEEAKDAELRTKYH